MNSVAYVGVDVQMNRGCPCAVLAGDLTSYHSEWLVSPKRIGSLVAELAHVFNRVAVGIDAPRCPLTEPREHYWRGRKWHPRQPSEQGRGRHCEVVIAALKLANPQFTPLAGDCPQWMEIGFSLFSVLSKHADVYEVFPTASYHQLVEDQKAQLSINLAGFALGPKDMLDAYVSAFTVHEFLAGRGTEVGGGDGYGTIVLPRPLSCEKCNVLHWPED
jgi:predicted nuclease with RNAse H fold